MASTDTRDFVKPADVAQNDDVIEHEVDLADVTEDGQEYTFPTNDKRQSWLQARIQAIEEATGVKGSRHAVRGSSESDKHPRKFILRFPSHQFKDGGVEHVTTHLGRHCYGGANNGWTANRV